MSKVVNPVDIDIQIHICSSESMLLLNINSSMPILARGITVDHVEESKDYTFRRQLSEKPKYYIGLPRTLGCIAP